MSDTIRTDGTLTGIRSVLIVNSDLHERIVVDIRHFDVMICGNILTINRRKGE